jgi:hypothetical protein
MKKLLFIALLAATASGCALRSTKKVEKPGPMIGMTVEDFKMSFPRAGLVYLTTDSATYKVYRLSNTDFWIDDFYYFGKGKLAKFEQKTHFFNNSTVTIEHGKDKKN